MRDEESTGRESTSTVGQYFLRVKGIAERAVGAALRGRPSLEFDAGAATEGRPYSTLNSYTSLIGNPMMLK
jgi:hypothetical protein